MDPPSTDSQPEWLDIKNSRAKTGTVSTRDVPAWLKERSPSSLKLEEKPIWLERSKVKEPEKTKEIPPINLPTAAEIFGLEPSSEPNSPKEEIIIKPSQNLDGDEPSTIHYILAGEKPQHQFLFNWTSNSTKKKKKPKQKTTLKPNSLSKQKNAREEIIHLPQEIEIEKEEIDEVDEDKDEEEKGLPDEIFTRIISKLSVRDIANIRLVCEDWKRRSENIWNEFIRKHKREMDKKNKLANEKKRQELKKQEEYLYAQLNKKVEDISTHLFIIKNETLPSLMNETKNEIKAIVPLSSKIGEIDQSSSIKRIEGVLEGIYKTWNKARSKGLVSNEIEETAFSRLTNSLKSQLVIIKEKAILSTDLISKQKLLEALEELSKILPTDTLKTSLQDPSSYPQSNLKTFINRYREILYQLGLHDSSDFANTTETYISKLIEGVSISKDISKVLIQQSTALQDILSNLDDEDKQLAILELSDNLHQLSSNIVTASKRAFNGFGNKATREKLDKVIVAIKNEISNNDLPMGDSKVLVDMLTRLENLSKSATIPVIPISISKAMDELVNNIKKHVTVANDMSVNLSIYSKPFQEAMDYLKNATVSIYPTIRESLTKGSLGDVVDVIRNLEKYQKILEKETGGDSSVMKGGKSVINSALKVKKLAKQEIKRNYTHLDIARLLEKRMKKQAALIRNQANLTRDPIMKRAVSDIAEETLVIAKHMMDIVSTLIANPSDPNAIESFNQIIVNYQKQGDRLERLVPANVTLLNGSRVIVEKMKSLKGLLIENQDDANGIAKDIIAQMSKQVALGRAAAITYKDMNLRLDILRICDELEGLIPIIVDALKVVFKNPQDGNSIRVLTDRMDRAKELSTQLNKLIPDANELNGQYLDVSLHKLSSLLEGVSELVKAREIMSDFASKEALQDLQLSVKDPSLLDHLQKLTAYLGDLKSAVDADVQAITQDLEDGASQIEIPTKLSRQNQIAKNIVISIPLARYNIDFVKNIEIREDGKFKEMMEQMIGRIELGRKIAISVKSLKLRQEILSTCQEMEDLVEPVIDTYRSFLDDPENEDAKLSINEILEHVGRSSDKIDTLLPDHMDVIDNGRDFSRILETLLLKATTKDEDESKSKNQIQSEEKELSLSVFRGLKSSSAYSEREKDEIDTAHEQFQRELAENGTIPAFLNLWDFEFLNTEIFNSDFFLLEIARLKTKYEYDTERKAIGDIGPNFRNFTRIPRSSGELMKIAERDEIFATLFAEKEEYEWARILVKQAIMIRKELCETTNQEDKQKHLFQIEKDWEKYIFLSLKGVPASDLTEIGYEKTLELLDSAANLTPKSLRNAKCPQYVNLWENRVKFGLLLYQCIFEREGPVDKVVELHLTPLLKAVPCYLDRKNEVLCYLWDAIFSIHKDEGFLQINHGLKTIKEYMISLHEYFHSKLGNEEEMLGNTVSDIFPLFADVCKCLCNIYLSEENYSTAQEFGVEELMIYLEIEEEHQDDSKVEDVWERVLQSIRYLNPKPSDQFFVLKEVLQEIGVYNNRALKDRIHIDMNKIGSGKEVKYFLLFTEQLNKCARLFLGDSYDEISEKLEGSSLLSEILANISSNYKSDVNLINELRILADLNYDFQFEAIKNKDYNRAKNIIEEGLLIRKYTDPSSITEDGVNVNEYTSISYDLLIDTCIILAKSSSKSSLAINILTQCYEVRPTFFLVNERLLKLWEEISRIQDFYQETLESLYKKFIIEKKKLYESRITNLQIRQPREGWITMRCNRTWQKRYLILRDQVLYIFKNEKAIRPRALISVKQMQVSQNVDEEILKVVSGSSQKNCFSIITPTHSYLMYSDSSEDKLEWVSTLEERRQLLVQANDLNDHLLAEVMINKELYVRHPLILELLEALGKIWDDQEYSEEAFILFLQGLELAAFANDPDYIKSFWNTIYNIILRNKNIFEILEFLEEEKERYLVLGLNNEHLIISIIEESLERITKEEDLKLRYMYQIRKYNEVSEDIVAARIYFLNNLYCERFLKNGSLNEAIGLMKDSLELLKKSLLNKPQDDLLTYYHISTWHRLVDLYILYSREREKQKDWYGGRILLQSAFNEQPKNLDPFNKYLNTLIDEIHYSYLTDPSNASSSILMTETTAFKWMNDIYLSYDTKLGRVYSFEAFPKKTSSISFRKFADKDQIEKKKNDFISLIKEHPFMMNICIKMAQAYYLTHQLEPALHMARHTLHIIIASMPNRHKEIEEQWKLCKKYFLAQRHSTIEVKNFVEEEKLFATVFLNSEHPHVQGIQKDLRKLEGRIALFEKYVPAAGFYMLYIMIFGTIGYILGVNENYKIVYETFGRITAVWLFFVALSLDLGLLTFAMWFIAWPPLPNDTLHRTNSILKRKKALKDVALMIACHNSGEVLPQTLRAALRIFPPDHIYICDNGNSSKPSDNSKEVCEKISREYQIQNNLSPNSPTINYFFMPEGNKTLVFWYGATYYCKHKYCMLIDDDVQLPPDLIVPMHKFKIPGTKVLAFTIGVENLHTHQGNIIYVSYWQDMEYKLAGFMKLFQSWVGSAIMAHGAISLWERKTLMEVLLKHDTVFHGDDLQMGLILQQLDREYRIETVGNVNVPTTVPDHVFCPTRPWSLRCVCPGKDGNLFGQRVRSWDVAAHRFIGKFFWLILFHWDRKTIAVKPFIIYELWAIFQDWVRIPLSIIVLIQKPISFFQNTLIFSGVGLGLLIIFNLWVLRRRPDQQHPWKTLLFFPLYKLIAMLLRFVALWYNLLYYTPFVRNRVVLGVRQDLPLGPEEIALLNSLAKEETNELSSPIISKGTHDWEVIAKLINLDSHASSPLSHWFLTCVSKLVWKKDNPKKKLSEIAFVKKSKKLIGRSDKYFYITSRDIIGMVPLSFISALNAMCFLSGRGKCLGKDPLKAVKILKWLWIEEILGENVTKTNELQLTLQNFESNCSKGISLSQFTIFFREIMRPTLQYLDISPQLVNSNVVHLQLYLEEEKQWGIKSLSLNTSDDRLVTRKYREDSFLNTLQNLQPIVMFIALPTSEDVNVEPYKPSVAHAVVLFDPIEKFAIIMNWSEKLIDRVFAVLYLLNIGSNSDISQFYSYNSRTGKVLSIIWSTIQEKGQKYCEQFNLVRFNNQKKPGVSFEKIYEQKPDKLVPLQFRSKKEDGKSVKINSLSPSGFWLLPVIDIMNEPILFINDQDKLLDSEVYFESFCKLIPANWKITSSPDDAVRRKITAMSGAKFLSNISWVHLHLIQDLPTNIIVFRSVSVADGVYEHRLVKTDKLMQHILVDYLASMAAKRILTLNTFNKWKLKAEKAF